MPKRFLFSLLLVVSYAYAQAQDFVSSPLSDSLFVCMQRGGSWKSDTPMSLRSELRHLRLLYCDGEGRTQRGEMIVNRRIAKDVLSIFEALYKAHYPIERIELVDRFGASDERSMAANNTSCFNFRRRTGGRGISLHGLGLAIDLNPLYNPYVKGSLCKPSRSLRRKGAPYPIINHQDLAYRLFRQYGFRWGGDWRSLKDYQHFEKPQ